MGATRSGIGSNSRSAELKFNRIVSTTSDMLYENEQLSIVSAGVENGRR